MARTSSNIFSPNGSKTDCIKIAKQLGYPDKVILALSNAKNEYERDKIMRDARNEGKTISKVTNAFGRSAYVVDEPIKRTPKEEPYLQVIWKRK